MSNNGLNCEQLFCIKYNISPTVSRDLGYKYPCINFYSNGDFFSRTRSYFFVLEN